MSGCPEAAACRKTTAPITATPTANNASSEAAVRGPREQCEGGVDRQVQKRPIRALPCDAPIGAPRDRSERPEGENEQQAGRNDARRWSRAPIEAPENYEARDAEKDERGRIPDGGRVAPASRRPRQEDRDGDDAQQEQWPLRTVEQHRRRAAGGMLIPGTQPHLPTEERRRVDAPGSLRAARPRKLLAGPVVVRWGLA